MPVPLSLRKFPDRIAELGFSAQLPIGWIAHDLPAEEADFTQPNTLVPLALVTAPHAAIVFAFAARPAYDDGSLNDWASYLLSSNGLTARAIGAHTVAGVAALVGEATQPSELGTMVVRFAYLEDGGRLVNLSLMAPELFADTVRDAWFAMLASFALETPKGSRFTNATMMSAPAPAAEAKSSAIGDEPATQELEPTYAGSQTSREGSETSTDRPAWWYEAVRLEQQNEPKAAEQLIRDHVPHLSFAYAIADMYRGRMLRLKNAGDAPGAREAFQRSSEFIFFYAAQATSGGEGTALSAERDAFRAQLVNEYGSDPEA